MIFFCGFPVKIAVKFKKCLFFYPIKNIVIHVCGNCQGFKMFVKGEMEQGRVTKGIHLKKTFYTHKSEPYFGDKRPIL